MDVPVSVGGVMQWNEQCILRTAAQEKKGTEVLLQNYTQILQLDIVIDVLPLYKSSSVGLWPILGKIVNDPILDIFIIGCYVRKSKPINVDSFLHGFIKEMKSKSASVNIGGKIFSIQIRAIIWEGLARSYLCAL